MGLIERIKSALGLRSSGSESQSRATTGDGSSPSRDSATESDRDDIETGRETETGVETGTGADTEDEWISKAVTGDEVESDDDSGSDAGTGDDCVDVTVEHEPETDSRDTEPDGESAAVGERPTDSEPAPDAAEPDTASEDAVKGTDTDTGEGGADADVEDLKGIGPTYGERLREAGYGTVDALAAADADTVADESGIAESRIEKWIDRARTY